MTVAAAVAGHGAWLLLGSLSWHRLALEPTWFAFPDHNYLEWLGTRVDTLRTAILASMNETIDVVVGVGVLSATIPASAVLLARAIQRGPMSSSAENQLIFGMLAACSALSSLVFLVAAVDRSGAWQFRFIAVPTAFAVVFLSSLAVQPLQRLVVRGRTALLGIALLGLLALTAILSAHRQSFWVPEEKEFERALAELERMIAARAGSKAGPLRGFSEYWIANEITTKSKLLRVATLDPGKPRFRFMLNNAEDLCEEGYFFILHNGVGDQPKRTELLAMLGQPTHTEMIDLVKYRRTTIYFYEPNVLMSRIVDEGRNAAARLFPTFGCGPRNAG